MGIIDLYCERTGPGLWSEPGARVRKKRLEMPKPDPAGTTYKDLIWDWDADISDGYDLG